MPQTKTVRLFVAVHGKSLRRDHRGQIYASQVLTANGQVNDVLGKVCLNREEAEGVLNDWRQYDTVVEVEGILPVSATFEVRENTDKNEGRGRMQTVGTFSSFEVAFEVGRGRGVMGMGDADIHMLTPELNVFNSKEDFVARRNDTSPTGERIYSSYFGLNGKQFRIVENVTDEERAEMDPQFAEYLRLKAIYG